MPLTQIDKYEFRYAKQAPGVSQISVYQSYCEELKIQKDLQLQANL